jgi:TM2 domain-containing membrane protein YozV
MAGRGKDRTAAGILGILLGGLGVHQFYLGSVGTGFILIAATIVTCGVGGAVLGLIEGIILLTMSDDDFNKRYNDRTPASVEFVFMKPKE